MFKSISIYEYIIHFECGNTITIPLEVIIKINI